MFQIDFLDLLRLLDCSLLPGTIGQAYFIHSCINRHYYAMNDDQRARFFKKAQDRLLDFEKKDYTMNEITQRFLARFDPDNKYLVTVDYDGEIRTTDAYKCNGRFYRDADFSLAGEYITEIKKLKLYEKL